MCWATYNKELIVPKIAEDNIVCNKLVRIDSNNIIKSDYFNFVYSLNTIYRHNQDLRVNENSDIRGKLFYEIHEGFYSYSTNIAYETYTRKNGYGRIKVYYYKDNSFHNLLDSYLLTSMNSHQLCMASCIIPKGSTYFLNELGEYVSDSIKMLNVFKINNL